MGAVSYGQGGYVGTSMSVRARQAYESGEMPMSKWTRGAIISSVKDYCADFDLAYEAFHSERCTRFLSKRSKREMIGYELPDKAADWGMKPEQTCPVGLAARSHVACFNAFRDGTGGDTEWHDLDLDAVEELFDERGLDDLLEAKRDEAKLSEDLGLVRESDCR